MPERDIDPHLVPPAYGCLIWRTACDQTRYTNKTSVSRWNEMWVDIALRHKYEKNSCAHALGGYSKDAPAFSHRRRVTLARDQVLVKAPGADLEARKQSAQRAEDSIRALSAKIDGV